MERAQRVSELMERKGTGMTATQMKAYMQALGLKKKLQNKKAMAKRIAAAEIIHKEDSKKRISFLRASLCGWKKKARCESLTDTSAVRKRHQSTTNIAKDEDPEECCDERG